MQLILLPGNSAKNESWLHQLEEKLRSLFDSTYAHKWQHWSGKTSHLNSQKELEIITQNLQKPYSIFAKSAGVSITLQGIDKNILSPKKLIFVGTAANLATNKNQKILSNLNIPTLFIQQQNDPFNKAKTLKKAIKTSGLPSYEFHTIKGSDHIYKNLEKIQIIIKNFLQKEK